MTFKRILFLATMLALTGCSKPVLEIAEPSEEQQSAARNILENANVGPSRHIARSEMAAAVGRVLPPVKSAAYEVCNELAQPRERCELMRTARVTVYPDNAEINAYADGSDSIGIFGGLVDTLGNDAEIAAILAHEYSHIMYGHVDRKMSNALIGLTIAGGLAAGISSGSGSHYDRQTTESIMRLGAEIGANAYSPEMEIEADRTAVYILHRAGFPASAMQNALVRLSHARARRHDGTFSGQVGFLQTHPSNDRRVAHVYSAIQDAESGIPLVVSGSSE